MILQIYTMVHVLISLLGIFTGLIVLFGMLAGKRLDGWTKLVSDNDPCHERDRLLLSVSWFHPGHWRRHNFAAGAGSCDLRALPASTRRSLALDLRRWRCDFTLFQCLRSRRAVV